MADEQPGFERNHTYHAEATVLKGDLYHPLPQEIKPQTNAKLSERGGYLSEHAEPYRLEGVIAFDRAYTQVAGNPNSKKPEKGWNTLVTSVVEGLNVLEVVTADRVIGQIATHHPREGYVPRVHFLGTRFENLRIAGHPVEVHLHHDHPFHFTKPENDGPYTQHPGFLGRLKEQFELLRGSEGVSADLLKRYSATPSTSEEQETIECSLVERIECPRFCRCYRNVIDVPDFGKIHLATLKIEHSDYDKQKRTWKKTLFDLKMIELDMGCIGGGTAMVSNPVTNGGTYP